MKIFLGTDHAGFELKEKIKTFLVGLGHEVKDFGAESFNEDDDYPDFITPVAQAVSKVNESQDVSEVGLHSMGIIFGGSGQGEAMCANRISGVRAGVYHGGDFEIIRLMREHNNANILSMGARFISSEEEAKDAVRVFLDTKFSNDERHVRRLSKF